jgi:hypothetical protein
LAEVFLAEDFLGADFFADPDVRVAAMFFAPTGSGTAGL